MDALNAHIVFKSLYHQQPTMCFSPLSRRDSFLEICCPISYTMALTHEGVIIACCKTQKREVLIYVEQIKQMYRFPFYKGYAAKIPWIAEIFDLTHAMLQQETEVGLNLYLDSSTDIQKMDSSTLKAIFDGVRFLLNELFDNQKYNRESHNSTINQ